MFHRFSWTSTSARRNSVTEEYEPLQPYFLLSAMKTLECASFGDVGANVGAYSVLASQVPSLTKIVAFEANKKVADELDQNLRLNSVEAEVRREAVSNEVGTVEFGIVSEFAGTSGIASTSRGDIEYSRRESVAANTLDQALKDAPYPIGLKIDVEGHEEHVLLGAQKILSGGGVIIQIENYGERLAQIFNDLGYRMLAEIGPDQYFTNDPSIDARQIFEAAARELIASNHENKRITLRCAGIGIELSGKPYQTVKRIAEKLLKSRL